MPTTAGTARRYAERRASVPEQRREGEPAQPADAAGAGGGRSRADLALPPALTASTGLDALTQLIEPFVSVKANPLTDALAARACRASARALAARVSTTAATSTARSDMALGSLFGGLRLANAELGAVHGFAAPIGGMFPAPHGAVCAPAAARDDGERAGAPGSW